MTSIERRAFLDSAAGEAYTLVAERRSVEPEISVVITSFDRRELLRQCLEALFAQQLTHGSFEVVVVDNGSRDGTAEMLTEIAQAARCGFLAARVEANLGIATARNLGVQLARGRLIAFTDSDCLATPTWLQACVESMGDGVGIVQGCTAPEPSKTPSLFSHYIVTDHLDGSYSTSNICYRRRAIVEVGGFDPSCDYWEDTDLGWRVLGLGWAAEFAAEAMVYHQVIPLRPAEWLKWPLHFRAMPAKAARHPEFRSHLFLGVWVHWFHALFDLALISLPLAVLAHPAFLALAAPYLLAFPKQHGLRGRLPPAKAIFHLAWDGVSFLTLLVSSVRHRAIVL